MADFFSQNLQTIMMVSFLVAAFLGMYKVYVMFESKEGDGGVDIKTIENELSEIVESILKETKLDKNALFEAVRSHERFDKERYKNFNQNRLNQVLDLLHIRHKTETFDDLLEKLKGK